MHGVSKGRISPSLVRYSIYLGLNILTGLVAAISVTYITRFNPFLIFLPTVAFCAWYGGFLLGFATTIISTVSVTVMLFFPANTPLLFADMTLFIETCIFFFVGTFTSYIIHIAKQQEKITDYKKRLRQYHHVVEILDRSYETAQTEIKARDQFLAIASHELKTPVTAMLLEVQTAIHNIRNVSLANFSVATLLKMLEDTEQQSKRLSKMINDLLDLSLITTGKIDLEIEKTNISDIVSTVAERYATRLPNKNQLTISIQKPAIGYVDKVRIEQAIINLVSNAIKYGNNNPITIRMTNSAEWTKITVKDQGIGIPAEVQKKIFNRFERAVSSREYKGLGVGLYVTQQIVKAHNGEIRLRSKQNKGSAFTIKLPLKQLKA